MIYLPLKTKMGELVQLQSARDTDKNLNLVFQNTQKNPGTQGSGGTHL